MVAVGAGATLAVGALILWATSSSGNQSTPTAAVRADAASETQSVAPPIDATRSAAPAPVAPAAASSAPIALHATLSPSRPPEVAHLQPAPQPVAAAAAPIVAAAPPAPELPPHVREAMAADAARLAEDRLLTAFPGEITVDLPAIASRTTLAARGALWVVLCADGRLVGIDLVARRKAWETLVEDPDALISGGDTRIAALSRKGGTLDVIDAATGARILRRRVADAGTPVSCAMGIETDARIAIVIHQGDRHRLEVQELESGAAAFVHRSLSTDHEPRPARGETVVASPSLRYVAYQATLSSALAIFDLHDGTLCGTFHSYGLASLGDDGTVRVGAAVFAIDGVRPVDESIEMRALVPAEGARHSTIPSIGGRFNADIDGVREHHRLAVRLPGSDVELACVGGVPPPYDREWFHDEWSTRVVVDVERARAGIIAESGRAVALREIPALSAPSGRAMAAAVTIGRTARVPLGGTWSHDLRPWPSEGIRVTLRSAPDGVTCAPDGKLSWSVGSDEAMLGGHEVIVEVAADEGATRLERLRVEIVPYAHPGVASGTADVDGRRILYHIFPGGALTASDVAGDGVFVAAGGWLHRFDGALRRAEKPPLRVGTARRLTARGGTAAVVADGTVRIIDVATWSERRAVPWPGENGEVLDAELDHDGDALWLAAARPGAPVVADRHAVYRLDAKTGAIQRVKGMVAQRLLPHPDGWMFAMQCYDTELARELASTHAEILGKMHERSHFKTCVTRYSVRGTSATLIDGMVVGNMLGGDAFVPRDAWLLGDASLLALPGMLGTELQLCDPATLAPVLKALTSNILSAAKVAGTSVVAVAIDGRYSGSGNANEIAFIDAAAGTALPEKLPYQTTYDVALIEQSDPRAVAVGTGADGLRRDLCGQFVIERFADVLDARVAATSPARPRPKVPDGKAARPRQGDAAGAPAAGRREPAKATVARIPKRSDLDGLTNRSRTKRDAKDVAAKSATAVVLIESGRGFGSGFVIGKNGWVLTAAHVLPPEGAIRIVQKDAHGASHTYAAEVAAIDHGEDLALLFLPEAKGMPTVTSDFDRKPALGEAVVVIGNPGVGGDALERTLTTGVVSSPRRELDGRGYIQTSASVNPGSSGCPMFDERGNVSGIIVLKANIEGAGFAVSGDRVKAFLEKCLKP